MSTWNGQSTQSDGGLRILALQSFAGGSHRAMLDGWRRHSRHDWTVLELPPVHWKWRMRHGPLTFAEQANRLLSERSTFDLVFCTDMLPLHEWRGLVGPPLAHLPALVYFHENQLTYPLSAANRPDLHYGYTNLLTLLAADAAWFNSNFHRHEFRRAALELLAHMPDHRHMDRVGDAFDRAAVCPPGIELPKPSESQRSQRLDGEPRQRGPLRVGWVGRWEHDKRPDRFVEAIDRLADQQHSFQLILLGQRFRTEPEALRHLTERHAERIVFNGYAASQQEYWNRLAEIDVAVSTADHEFFGIGIAEAVAAGAMPLAPERLAYPELLGRGEHPDSKSCFYDGSSAALAARLAEWTGGRRGREATASPSGSLRDFLQDRMRRFDWERLAPEYDDRLEQLSTGDSPRRVA